MSLGFPFSELSDVKGVLIDIDNTLYSYDPAHQSALRRCHEEFCGDFQEVEYSDFEKRYRSKRNEVSERLSPQGACRSRMFAFQALFEEMKVPYAFNDALRYESLYWDSLISAMSLLPEASDFIDDCNQKRRPICAVSDMQAHIQVRKLQQLNVHRKINYLVTSEEVGSEKPHPTIYEVGLRKLNLKADQVIMVGDHDGKDIQGAESCGVRAFKITIKDD